MNLVNTEIGSIPKPVCPSNSHTSRPTTLWVLTDKTADPEAPGPAYSCTINFPTHPASSQSSDLVIGLEATTPGLSCFPSPCEKFGLMVLSPTLNPFSVPRSNTEQTLEVFSSKRAKSTSSPRYAFTILTGVRTPPISSATENSKSAGVDCTQWPALS